MVLPGLKYGIPLGIALALHSVLLLLTAAPTVRKCTATATAALWSLSIAAIRRSAVPATASPIGNRPTRAFYSHRSHPSTTHSTV